MLLLIGLVTLATRLAVLPQSTELNMDADAPHFMNVARCFARGQGFSNSSAWPAWMKPERLPMPETFKEPGYPWAIARFAPPAGSFFRAGQLISFIAGLMTPFLTWLLVRRLHPRLLAAHLAGLMAAASPLLIAQSSRVMVESVFAAVFTLLWVLLLPRPGAGGAPGARDRIADVGAGVLLGVAFMLRAQTLMALPAIAALLATGSGSAGRTLRRAAVILATGIVTASPFLLRNLRLFGVPFHSDVAAFGLWPYSDLLSLSTTLDRPPAPIGWALHHIPQVLARIAWSTERFTAHSLPEVILGHPLWMVPLAAGLLLSFARWRSWLFVYLQLGLSMAFLFAINWDARYFATAVPLWAALAATGGVWLAGGLGGAPLPGRLRGAHLLAAIVAALVGLQSVAAWRLVHHQGTATENEAARIEAPFLRAHLAPDEAVMAFTTSYYSYWTDRPAVYVVVADTPAFMEVVRRLKVRYAALPTSALAGLAARYPGGRLPAALVVDHASEATDVTVFRVVDHAARAVTASGSRR